MGLLKKVLRERRRGRRDFGPRIFGPRSIPKIPVPVLPKDPLERLPFDDPRNDFMSIQRIEDVGVPGITPIEPVMPPPIPAPIPPVLPKPVLQQPQPPQTGGIPVTGGGPLGSGILPIADLPTSPAPPPTNIGIQIPDVPVGRIVASDRPPSIGGIGGINQDFRPIKMPLPKPDDFMSIGGPGGGFTDNRVPEQLTLTLPTVQEPLGEPNITPDPTMTPAPTTPAAVADDVGAVPPTTIPADTRGQIDPVLAQQDTTEVLSDPLLRALYFGTADQPGFINQLQQATQNVMGAELPSTQFDPSMTQQFFNPFEDRVVQQTIQDVMEAGEKRDIQQRARDIQTGGLSAFGSRARLTAADRQEALGRGLAEALGGIRQSGFSEAQRTALGQFGDQYTRQMGQINRPIDLLTTVGRSLPGYGAQQTRIESQYRLPVDPTAAGLGAAFGTYASLKPTQTTTT